MSNKNNLLNESQIRQFMKLAKLEPLTPGFVDGLTEKKKKEGYKTRLKQHLGPDKGKGEASEEEREHESEGEEESKGKGKFSGDPGMSEGAQEELEELRTGRPGALGPKNGTANLGHGRGQGEAADGSMFEAAPVGELEDDAADDLAGGSPEEDEEAAVDLEKVGDEEADAAVDAVEVEEGPSEEEVLAALQVIARAAGVEGLEMDVESTGEPSVEDELGPEPEDEFAPEGPEVVADLEVGEEEEALEEFNVPVVGKAARDARAKKKQDIEDLSVTSAKRTAFDKKTGGSGAKLTRSPRGANTYGLGGAYGSVTEESTDDLVEQITKRVAARILKSALSKK